MAATNDDGLAPIRALETRIDKSMRGAFVEQTRKFGDAFGFRIVIRNSSPDPDDVLFQMWRQDIDVIGGNSSDTGAPDLTFKFGFYPKRSLPPPPPANVDRLVEGLKQFIGRVRGATITQRK